MILLTTVDVVTILLTKVDDDAPYCYCSVQSFCCRYSAFALLNNVDVGGANASESLPNVFLCTFILRRFLLRIP